MTKNERDFVNLHGIEMTPEGTVIMPRDTFDILMRNANLVGRTNSLVKVSREMKQELLDKIIGWIRLNYTSDRLRLERIKGTEYITISNKELKEILKELGVNLSATQFLKCLGEKEFLHNKNYYSLNRHGNRRVVVLTATTNYVDEYKEANGVA